MAKEMKSKKVEETEYKPPIDRIGRFYLMAIVSVIGILLVVSSVVMVKAGHRGVLLTWGKVSLTPLSEGIHLKNPISQRVKQISVKTQKRGPLQYLAATKDIQDLYVDLSANYHVLPDSAPKVFRDLGIDAYKEIAIDPVMQQIVKENTVKFEAENILANRNVLRQQIEDQLRERLLEYGIYLEYIHIENIDFREEYRIAIERKATAVQNLLAEERELEITKIEAQKTIEQARGEADAMLLDAEAKAKALELQKVQITEDLIEYKAIEKWNGVMPQYTCGVMPFVNVGDE